MPRKILVVDDKLFMVRLIQHHLEKAGFELIRARNREEAMEAIESQSPELMVMDDGADSNYSGHAAHNIPTIRMTDVVQNSEDDQRDNADVVLTKPFSPTQLMAEVRRLVPES